MTSEYFLRCASHHTVFQRDCQQFRRKNTDSERKRRAIRLIFSRHASAKRQNQHIAVRAVAPQLLFQPPLLTEAAGQVAPHSRFVEREHRHAQLVQVHLPEAEVAQQFHRFLAVSLAAVGLANHDGELCHAVLPVHADDAAAPRKLVAIDRLHGELVLSARVAGLLGQPLLFIRVGRRERDAAHHPAQGFRVVDELVVCRRVRAFKRTQADSLALYHACSSRFAHSSRSTAMDTTSWNLPFFHVF